jgi:hypothetical protein
MKTNFGKIFFQIVFGVLLTAQVVSAQDESDANADTLATAVEGLQSDLSLLQKLKITGYVQAQWQYGDTIGAPALFSGGDFKNYDNRFMVRRGRVKFAYANELSNYVLQFDVTEKGLGIKDAYFSFTDPWINTATVTGGVFDRPFGFEISYSSSTRETPERSRIFQTLFPGEREVGAKLTLQAPKTSNWNFIKLDVGLFNGNGISIESDKYKDFIGHLGMKKSYFNETFTVGVGASYYNGGFALPVSSAKGAKLPRVYKMQGNAFVAQADSGKVGDKIKREYMGLDMQMSLHSVIGLSQLRGEYILGTQPAFASLKSTVSPTNSIPTADDVYVRNVSGGYVCFVQSIGQTKHELVAKYDWYDPNTKVSKNELGAANTNTGKLDVSYNTIGLGWIYHWNSNIKITAYYEIVNNEKSNYLASAKTSGISSFANDQKDNIFTLRVQYKF